MTTTTVSGNAVARYTSGHFLGVSVTSAPLYGIFSVHDCADPGQMSPLNCIYPLNFAADDNPTGIAVKRGITVHSRAGSGTFAVNHTT